MKFGYCAVFLTSFALVFAAVPATKKVASGKKTPATTKKTASKRRKATAASGVAANAWRTHQQAPTPERYKEIQQALATKGYLKSEPTGVWDAESTDALRQFQTDNKLSPTGKISAASLIGLGLGSSAPAVPAAAATGRAPAAPAPDTGPL